MRRNSHPISTMKSFTPQEQQKLLALLIKEYIKFNPDPENGGLQFISFDRYNPEEAWLAGRLSKMLHPDKPFYVNGILVPDVLLSSE